MPASYTCAGLSGVSGTKKLILFPARRFCTHKKHSPVPDKIELHFFTRAFVCHWHYRRSFCRLLANTVNRIQYRVDDTVLIVFDSFKT